MDTWNCSGHGSEDHMGQSYMIGVIMTGCTITRTKRCIRATPPVEDYFRKEILKVNRS